MTKPRRYALAGVGIGLPGLVYAVWCCHPLTVAFCGVMWGSTLTLAAIVWRGRR